MEPKEKRGKGRPSKKESIDFEQVEKLAGYGLTDVEIANILDINESTLNRWKKDPLFLQVLKKGKDKANSKVIESLFNRANGFEHDDLYIAQYQGHVITKKIMKYFPPDTMAAMYWLNNRQRDKWRYKQEGDTALSDEEITKLKNIALEEAIENI